MLSHILNTEDYALCLTPGFFRFYAHVGILHALEECDLLKPKYVTGSSAGALVGAFLAAGRKPSEMIEAIMPMERKDFWDMGGIGGLLKGQLFHEAIEKHLPVPNIEECPIPFACTAYDTVRFRTKKITSGSIATAARASCTFPGLFQPVMIDGTPHIDGGVWDWTGLMALDECILADARRKQANSSTSADATSSSAAKLDLETLFPRNKLIVNICYDTDFGSRLPASLSHARLLTIVVENIPAVTPFTMGKMGIEAYKLAKAAMHRALFSCHMQELSSNHWCCYVDGNLVHHIPPEIRNSLPSPQVSVDEPFTPRSLPLPTQVNISQRSSQQQLSLPTSSQQPSSTQARLGQLSRTSSSITNTSDHNLAETALFHVHEDQAASSEANTDDDEVAQSTSLLPSMPGVNLLPSFHLPHLPEHLGDFVPLPSYHFVNGTYFYEAFHHTAQNAADTLHQTLHAVNTTMTSTLDSLLSMGNTGRGIKRRRDDDEGEEKEDMSNNNEQMNVDTTSTSEGDRPTKQARVEEEEAHTQVDDDVTHQSSSQSSAFDATGLSSTLVDSQCEELMDYPTSQGTSGGRVANYHPRRDSEDLDDALAILDAVEFMASSHHLTSTQTQGMTATQDSPSALPSFSQQQTQYSPPRTQVSPPTTGIEDAIEVFASVLDGEVAGSE